MQISISKSKRLFVMDICMCEFVYTAIRLSSTGHSFVWPYDAFRLENKGFTSEAEGMELQAEKGVAASHNQVI